MQNFPEIHFSDKIIQKIPGFKVGIFSAHQVCVRRTSSIVESEMIQLYDYIKNKFADKAPSTDAIVSLVRRLYRSVGWEPTRYRPSSEAMIRRILKNINLYVINNLVDLGNITSARFHIPLGLYDQNKINGSIELDVGRNGETYEGLSIPVIHAEGKLILRDSIGIFGNPTADSKRTCIDNTTTSILGVFFTPPEVLNEYVNDMLVFMKDLFERECPDSASVLDIIAA